MHPYRLPTTVVPTRYQLRLEPDLAAATFRGEEAVVIKVVGRTAEIVLKVSVDGDITVFRAGEAVATLLG